MWSRWVFTVASLTNRRGLFSGPSTGANLVAALQVARRLGPGHRVATIQVDSGLKYLSGHVFETAPTSPV